MPFAPFFVGEDMPDFLENMDQYRKEEARQKAAYPDDKLQADARMLIEEISEVWGRGAVATAALAELLEEKGRRLEKSDEQDWRHAIVAWLESCGIRELDQNAIPNEDDVRNLILYGESKLGSDACACRPGFYDLL